jgi:ketosteroid isomerase-like protein
MLMVVYYQQSAIHKNLIANFISHTIGLLNKFVCKLVIIKDMNKQLVIIIIATIWICGCAEKKIDNTKEKMLIEKTIRSSIGWAKDKNLSLLYNVIANDSSFLEVHPGPKIVRGFSEFRKAEEFWLSPDFRAIRYDISDLMINISASGDAAWWFCMLDDINLWKGEPAEWRNTRWTGVLEKRDGRWVIVQQHFSFASGD